MWKLMPTTLLAEENGRQATHSFDPAACIFVVIRYKTPIVRHGAGKGTIGKDVTSLVASTIGTWQDVTDSVAAAVVAVVTRTETNTPPSLRLLLLLLLELLGRRLL